MTISEFDIPTLKLVETSLAEFAESDSTVKVCVSCHPECNLGCTGLSDIECTRMTQAQRAMAHFTCVNVEVTVTDADGFEQIQCLPECPDGFFELEPTSSDCKTVADTSLRTGVTVCPRVCQACPAGCATCDRNETQSFDIEPAGTNPAETGTSVVCLS